VTAFRPLHRSEVEGVVFATRLGFARALNDTWSIECARNFVMGLLDGEVADVFGFARELLASPTRAAGRSLLWAFFPYQTTNEAAALATIAYVDAVTKPDNALHRWAILLGAGIPDNVLRRVELR
jgi:hypothetical protein